MREPYALKRATATDRYVQVRNPRGTWTKVDRLHGRIVSHGRQRFRGVAVAFPGAPKYDPHESAG